MSIFDPIDDWENEGGAPAREQECSTWRQVAEMFPAIPPEVIKAAQELFKPMVWDSEGCYFEGER